MDVTESRLRRELEQSDRLLKERQENHSRELENLRANQRQQLDSLDKTQRENVDALKKSADEQLTSTRDNFDKENNRTIDSFERALADERHANYDKLGRLSSEAAIERYRDREAANQQLQNLAEANRHQALNNKLQQTSESEAERKNFEAARRELKEKFDAKLDWQNHENTKALEKTIASSRKKIDDNIRSNDERLFRDRLGEELKYRKLSDENIAQQKNLRSAFSLREQQLADEKSFLESKVSGSGQKTFDEYKQRTQAMLDRMTQDNHFQIANKDRINANRLAEAAATQQTKLQDMRSEFRKRENDLNYRNDVERDQNKIREALAERRHKQDSYINAENARAYDQEQREMQRATYAEQLHDLDDKNQRSLHSVMKESQKRMAEQEQRSATEREALGNEKSRELMKMDQKTEREKHNLMRAYEDRHSAFEDLKARQFEDQKKSFAEALIQSRDDAAKTIFRNNRENTIKTYLLNEHLKNHTNESETYRRSELDAANDTYRGQVKRLTENYQRANLSQRDNFEEASDALRYENELNLGKMRADSNHERRLQLFDLQTKNRALATSFESRLNQMQDEHTADLVKMKNENEKAMRDTLKKAKEQLDGERALHTREMEAKDLQMKEKLKQQEESFREQIERLRRTHELTIKKS